MTSAWGSEARIFFRVRPKGEVPIPEAIERLVQLYEALDEN